MFALQGQPVDRMEDDPEQLGQMQSFAQQEQLLRFLELQFASVPNGCICSRIPLPPDLF